MNHLIRWAVHHSRLADRFDSFLMRRRPRYRRWRIRFEAAELRADVQRVKQIARRIDPDVFNVR